MALEEVRGTSVLVREPIGVAALITPWNWPINQVFTKTAGALAAGCTMVLKPSEIAPLNALLFAEIVHEAGAPPGVFNLVNGEGPTVGHALAAHPDVDVVSFTGSTRAGKLIAKAAAETVKRVHQELGGKSPNVILDDADLEAAVTTGVHNCFSNAGQSCSVAEAYIVGDPLAEATTMGPIVNAAQFAHVQRLIQAGISEGARLVTGGTGLPTGLNRGYFTRPTVFADVKPGTSIEQQEIFGPVLSIVPYDSEEQAVEIANDTIYGLAAVVQSRDLTRARRVANQLRAGHVYLNHQADAYAAVPFGGYKQSGNGYEHGEWGIEAFQQIKAILGAG
jgi:aldehyde dehydrogenase (NAD+)